MIPTIRDHFPITSFANLAVSFPMAALDSIPIVDFSGILAAADLDDCPQVRELHTAFSQVGFVFLKNHGIKSELVIIQPQL